MQKESQTLLNSEEWTAIRDFTVNETGFTLPKYEAKFVDGIDNEYIENEIVLVKVTKSTGGGGRMYHLPKAVFEGVVDQLP